MPTKTSTPRPDDTAIYEMRVTFAGRATPLVCQIEEAEHSRLLAFADDTASPDGFYGVNLPPGHAILLNTRHVNRINLLDPLPGIRLAKATDLPAKDREKRLEKRERDDTPVILRLWLRGEEHPVVHHDIDYAEAQSIDLCLEENPDRFIHFEDEDGELVLYSVSHLDGVEIIDPYFLTEKQVETLLGPSAG